MLAIYYLRRRTVKKAELRRLSLRLPGLSVYLTVMVSRVMLVV